MTHPRKAIAFDSLNDADGELGRYLEAPPLIVPARVELDGARLAWRLRDGEQEWRRVHPGKNLLVDFVNLADGPDETIEWYASRWGVLGICEHGLPASHNPPPFPVPREKQKIAAKLYHAGIAPRRLPLPASWEVPWCYPRGWPYDCRESLDVWRRLSRQARAILKVADALHAGWAGELADWKAALRAKARDPWWKVFRELKPREQIEAGWQVLEKEVNAWLVTGNVRPQLYLVKGVPSLKLISGGDPAIQVIYGGLFSALSAQLLFAVSGTQGFAFCSGCGDLYHYEKRRPKSGQHHFCPDCREGNRGSMRLASARYRERKRQTTGRKRRK
ncbi:MAG TPA: hypothetical protein VNO70_16135 [Blastocatellia bacterium]|nr:hypothetical protein [Blastocatellia bacterium]